MKEVIGIKVTDWKEMGKRRVRRKFFLKRNIVVGGEREGRGKHVHPMLTV